MFILGDEFRTDYKFPWVTVSLILLNIAVFGIQCKLGDRFSTGFALVPKEISTGKDLTKAQYVKVKVPVQSVQEYRRYGTRFHEVSVKVPHYPGPKPIFLTLLTSMFLHVNLVHLIGNMWFMAVFARNVEHALDHGRFLIFYLACGLVGGIAHVLSQPTSFIPCMGASGAISGLMGAYVAIYPLNKIKVWLGWMWGVIELPAIAVVGIWFLFQYLSAFASLDDGPQSGGVAYWDHIGGFLAGVGGIWGMIFFLKWQQARQPTPVEGPSYEDQPAAEHDSHPETGYSAATGASPAGRSPLFDPLADFMPQKGAKSGEIYSRQR